MRAWIRMALAAPALLAAGVLWSSCSKEPDNCSADTGDYQKALSEATSCDPNAAVNQCSERIGVGLGCVCDAFVNPSQSVAIQELHAAQQGYAQNGCSETTDCPKCPQTAGGYCTDAGHCENVETDPVACVVNGERYEDGAGGVPDPVSCNTCNCRHGELSCTKFDCPMPCDEGTELGVACADCGPMDACRAIEHACYPTCVDTCDEGACIDGLCRPVPCG